MVNNLWDKKQKAFQIAVKKLRVDSKKTQQEVADILGKPQSYVSKYESGERKLDYLEVRDICEACNSNIYNFEKGISAILKSEKAS